MLWLNVIRSGCFFLTFLRACTFVNHGFTLKEGPAQMDETIQESDQRLLELIQLNLIRGVGPRIRRTLLDRLAVRLKS